MGAYVNPPGQNKEKWLEENATQISQGAAKRIAKNINNGATTELPVCLVDNGPFKAAGICFEKREFDAFSRSDDSRPKKWFKAKVDDLLEVSGELENYMRHSDSFPNYNPRGD